MPHPLPANPRRLNLYPPWLAVLQLAAFVGSALVAVAVWPLWWRMLIWAAVAMVAAAACFIDLTLRWARRSGRYPRWMGRSRS